METRGSKGYLLPEVIDPGQLQCITVYVPKDDYYIRAFSGAFHRLGTWQVWEKDGTTRAAEASLVWKNAIDYTMQNGWIGACGMTPECCNAIVSAINNININVSGGGGGCCSPVKDWNLPPGWEDELPAEQTEPDDTETELTTSELCDQAHQTHARMRDFIDQYPELTKAESPYDELQGYIIAIGIFIVPEAATMFALLTAVSSLAYGALEDETIAFWDSMKNDFICNLISHISGLSFYNWLVEYIKENSPNFYVKQWMLVLIQMPDWSKIYDGIFAIDEEFVDSDCSFCDAPPEVPEGFILIPLIETDIVSMTQEGGSNSHVFNEGLTQFTYTANVGEWNASTVTLNIDAVKARASALNIVGAVIEIISEDATDALYDQIVSLFDQLPGTFNFHMPDTEGGKIFRFKQDYYDTIPEYASWVDLHDFPSAYGSAPITGTAVPSWQVGSHFSPKQFVYRVWMVGELIV